MKESELSEILSALEYGGEELQGVALERLRAHTPQYNEGYQEMTEAARQKILRLALLLASYSSANSLRVLARVAQQVNRALFLELVAALEERATEPKYHRQLAYALPLLRRYNLGSLAYLRLHHALKAALSTRTLPIPAQEMHSQTDLPIPGEELPK